MYAWWDVIIIGNKAHRSPVYPIEVSFIYHTHAHSVPTLASSTSVCLSVILGRFCNCFWLSFLQEQKTNKKRTNQPIIHTNREQTHHEQEKHVICTILLRYLFHMKVVMKTSTVCCSEHFVKVCALFTHCYHNIWEQINDSILISFSFPEKDTPSTNKQKTILTWYQWIHVPSLLPAALEPVEWQMTCQLACHTCEV